MGPITALLVATPIFGLSLQVQPDFAPATAFHDMQVYTALREAVAEVKADKDRPPTTAELLERREKLGQVHRYLGIATWAAMTLTMATGFIQYYNQYGFFAGQGDNPCVKGKAIFGQKQCRGQPVFHLTTSALTGALYFATFGLSFAMPDPLNVSEGKSKFSKKLRTHKTLRWVHFSGMLAQILLGVVAANSQRFGLDRANDYKTLQILSTVHFATGLVTYTAMTWAGALLAF